MAAILDFTHNAVTNIRSGHIPMSNMLENSLVHTKIMIVLLFYLYCFTLLAQMAAILDFIHNAMSKVLSDYITMSGITEGRIVDIKIKNLRLFCRK